MRKTNLTEIAADLWAAETSLRFFGFPLKARMCAIRLGNGAMWLHSPIPLDMVGDELDALGPVRWLVAPNLLHHLYVGPYQSRYHDARLIAAPGLERKRPDLLPHRSTEAEPPAEWRDDIVALPIRGNPVLRETVFLHRPSRSLIISDLAVHLGPWDHWSVRLYAKLNRCYGVLGLSYGLKSFFKDKKAARECIDAILDMDFVRIIPAHGPIIEQDAKDALRRAFAWLR